MGINTIYSCTVYFQIGKDEPEINFLFLFLIFYFILQFQIRNSCECGDTTWSVHPHGVSIYMECGDTK